MNKKGTKARDPDLCACGKHFVWIRARFPTSVCLPPAEAMEARRHKRKRVYGPFPLVIATLDTNGSIRIMREKDAKELQRIARLHTQSTSRFTSETGRQARHAQMARRDRRGHQIGRRTGNRPAIDRQGVRNAAAEEPQRGANGSMYEYFPPLDGETAYPPGYWTVTDARNTRLISEVAALRGLGKLPRPRTVAGIPIALRRIGGTT